MKRPAKQAAAWGAPVIGEPRWQASIAVLAALALYVTLPERLTLHPTWIIPTLELALLIPLSIASPRRVAPEGKMLQAAAISLIGIINVANVASLLLLIRFLVHGGQATGGQVLIGAVQIWLTNIIVFGLWYWEIDRGGPDDRAGPTHREPDFLFPQMVTPACAPGGWSPRFVDYLFVAFTNASAFSPTDTMPLTPLAKSLMMIQALASLMTVALVAARAVNILS